MRNMPELIPAFVVVNENAPFPRWLLARWRMLRDMYAKINR